MTPASTARGSTPFSPPTADSMATTDVAPVLPSLQDRFYALSRRRQRAVLAEAGCSTVGAMFLSSIQLERIMNGISHGLAKQEALARAAAREDASPDGLVPRG
jgi:hypothetical protein